jgi:adenosylcobinamide kinase/adenosylcobinamide-phosphate guanylyltransferase
MNSRRHLVLGAARSGKTRFALNMAKSLAHAHGSDVIYVATAEARDVEMSDRIARHRAERPADWRTLEAPRGLGHALASLEHESIDRSLTEQSPAEHSPTEQSPTEHSPTDRSSLDERSIIIVDCLTLWLSNALLSDFNEATPTAPLPTWAAEREAFLSRLSSFDHTLILVSNEVGGGIVPTSALARRFQSEQGWLNQAVAAVCEQVTLVVAGLPLVIK